MSSSPPPVALRPAMTCSQKEVGSYFTFSSRFRVLIRVPPSVGSSAFPCWVAIQVQVVQIAQSVAFHVSDTCKKSVVTCRSSDSHKIGKGGKVQNYTINTWLVGSSRFLPLGRVFGELRSNDSNDWCKFVSLLALNLFFADVEALHFSKPFLFCRDSSPTGPSAELHITRSR